MRLLRLPHLLDKDAVAHIGVVCLEKSFVLVFIFLTKAIELEHLLPDFFGVDALKNFPDLVLRDVKLGQIARCLCLNASTLSLDLSDFFVKNVSELSEDFLDNL